MKAPHHDRHAILRRDEILSAVSRSAKALLQCSDWLEALNLSLRLLGEAVRANRAYYFESHRDENGVLLASQKAEWTIAPEKDGETGPQQNELLQNVPWIEAGMNRWLQLMQDGLPVYGLVEDFPESEQQLLRAQGIRSLVAMPVQVRDELQGFVGFDDCEQLRDWSAVELDALLAAGTALGAAIERLQLERQLRFAQKMEAVGRLAAGVAHDFNNTLQSIGAYASLARAKVGGGHPAESDLDQVLQAVDRAHGVTRQLLSFSREQKTHVEPLDINAACLEANKLAAPILGHSIRVVHDFHSPAPTALADATLVSQVLLNLCLNARDAMPGGGELTISTTIRRLPRGQLEPTAELSPGEYAVISVRDTGHGIPESLQDRIFEPFFTTKPAERGTGLGLSVAYGGIRHLGGLIDLESPPGKGAVFHVYLPLTQQESKAPRMSQTSQPGNETILVVDDDLHVRASSQALLETCGYRVIVAEDGREGLELFDSQRDAIDLVLTDTAMPNVDGIELLKAIRDRVPAMKTILLSGNSDQLHDRVAALEGPQVPILQKPIRADILTTLIREVLDSGRVGGDAG